MTPGLSLGDVAAIGAIVGAAWLLACSPMVVRHLMGRRGRGRA